jgi:hypothetical protein
MKTGRIYGPRARMTITLLFMVALGFTASCGFATGQTYGPCPGINSMPVTIAGPGGAIASAGGVTACAGTTGAIASAGGVTAGASALLPVAFAGPVAAVVPLQAGSPIII